MSGHFQYFVVPKAPGKTSITMDELVEYGLAYGFDREHPPTALRTMSGPRPDNSGGLVICSSTDRLGYYPERQKWRPMHGNADVWVGMESQHVPTPEDLRRKEQADGEWLTMRDGSQWLIPRARQYDTTPDGAFYFKDTLPAGIDLNANGEWIRGDVYAEYRRLWDLSNQFADGESGVIDDLFDAAIMANYRASTTELAMLGLLDTEWKVLGSVLDIVMDEKRGAELLKKTALLTAAISSGSNGVSPPTTDEQPAIVPLSRSPESGHGVFTGNTAGA